MQLAYRYCIYALIFKISVYAIWKIIHELTLIPPIMPP